MKALKIKALCAMGILCVASAVALAGEARLLPVDDAAGDLTWAKFKTKMMDVIAKRDPKSLLALLDGKIRNPSGKSGLPEFRKLWEPHSPDSPLWTELPRVLHLGGTFVKRDKGPAELCAPYVYYKWPEDASAAADAVLTANEVLLKSTPSSHAETRRTLSYHLVDVLDWEVADENKDSRQKWLRIQFNNESGYVPEEQLRSPLEYRACFVKSAAGWRMTSFEIGD
jgi:hypothetical protein